MKRLSTEEDVQNVVADKEAVAQKVALTLRKWIKDNPEAIDGLPHTLQWTSWGHDPEELIVWNRLTFRGYTRGSVEVYPTTSDFSCVDPRVLQGIATELNKIGGLHLLKLFGVKYIWFTMGGGL